MKRTLRALALVLALALITVFAASCGAAEPKTGDPGKTAEEGADLLQAIRDRGYITIATEGDWSPWTYHDDDDVLTGFDVELGKLIARELGVEARFEETAWDSILAGVDAGRFDVACNGVGFTDARAEKYTFSTPYVYTGAVLVVRKDNDEITKLEDLKGKVTANTASSTYASMAEEAGATVTPVDALQDTLNLVIDGRVDATLNARVTIETYLAEHPEAPVKIAAAVPGEAMVIPMQKNDSTASLKAEIDRILEKLRENGELKKLSEQYFDADLTRED
ncbi:MAG: transporter substrate-binding domain-containing protein [Clostridia bacterium]|nr:transporter substrate-binding domain-containing protein [Clostridia bacterium]